MTKYTKSFDEYESLTFDGGEGEDAEMTQILEGKRIKEITIGWCHNEKEISIEFTDGCEISFLVDWLYETNIVIPNTLAHTDKN